MDLSAPQSPQPKGAHDAQRRARVYRFGGRGASAGLGMFVTCSYRNLVEEVVTRWRLGYEGGRNGEHEKGKWKWKKGKGECKKGWRW